MSGLSVFDTSSIRELQHFYPGIFRTVWTGLDALVKSGELISTREVLGEIEDQNASDHVKSWVNRNRAIFTQPTAEELAFVTKIFDIPHFRQLIGTQNRLIGNPVADPFVIACARVRGGTVVTQELFKPNAAKIPNVCKHFNVPCLTLEDFMVAQGWSF